MLKIAISGTHGVGKSTLANKLIKVLGKRFDPKTELLLVPEYIRSNLRKDIGEQQTEDATLFYIRKAMNTFRIVDVFKGCRFRPTVVRYGNLLPCCKNNERRSN